MVGESVPAVTAPTALRGKLSGEAVERSGTFLVTADGARAQLVLPRGWRRSPETSTLLDASGRPVAAMGDEVVVTGGFAETIASIQQQGRMFRVSALRRADIAPGAGATKVDTA